MNAKRILCFLTMAAMLGGCSTKAIINNANEQAGADQAVSHIISQESSDKELFEDALSHLSINKKEPNYKEARIRLENLVVQFPKSKWSAGARALIATLDKISALQAALNKEKFKVQSEQVKLTKEIDGLKDSIRQIEENRSAELARLQQENEQLKKDIQQLKNLEIQLEKREKMLR